MPFPTFASAIVLAVAGLAAQTAVVSANEGSIEVDDASGNLCLTAPDNAQVEVRGDMLISGELTNTGLAKELAEIRSSASDLTEKYELLKGENAALRKMLDSHEHGKTCRMTKEGKQSGFVSFSSDWHNTYVLSLVRTGTVRRSQCTCVPPPA
jgi:hypothetical protein